MKPEDIHAYMDRDWDAVRELKERYWAEAKHTLTPMEALAIGDDLRQQGKALRPDWPNAEQREADIAHHIRISALLQRVPYPASN